MSTGSLIDIAHHDRSRADSCPVFDAITRLRAGEIVMVCDDSASAHTYDLVCAADRLTTARAAFMVRHTSGFLQVALRDPVCDRLQIPPVAPNADRMSSQQCVAVDAAVGVGTGISATDRTRTINLLGSPDAAPTDFNRPGHVVPIRVASRPQRHDAASLALTLVEMCGSVAAVLATVVGSGEDFAGLPTHLQSADFAARHGLAVIGHAQVAHARSA
ncbi:3,4-dihydroxy-2-butanone-4-phosphate synthase [Gordonia sp. PKS22-38]|uniref:3,4-dihydroxy-2-butanone-4-phosphate synthase n=1 Tax=Gordonia prachuapensis TaxID=3115651 RepID=A0ABU7MTG2_9ACTN|nr:3,4-dihydroxy-2-butanone-4-phosphate synthase [Gordonia sp. PKS22-38]